MIGDGVGLGFLIKGELYRGARSGGSEFGHVRLRRGGPQCRCGGRGCIEAFLADYALHRDAQLIDHRPAPDGLMPSEDAMNAIVGARGPATRPSWPCSGKPARCWATRSASSIQTLEPDHIVLCGPGTAPWTSCSRPSRRRLELQTIPQFGRWRPFTW